MPSLRRTLWRRRSLAGVLAASVVAVVYLCTRKEAPSPAPTPAEIATDNALDARVTVSFEDTPLDEALATLSRMSGVRMTYDRAAFYEAGGTADPRVTARLRDTRVRRALDVVVTEAPVPPEGVLIRRDGTVELLTLPELTTETFWHDYDLRPVMFPLHEHQWDQLQQEIVNLIDEIVTPPSREAARALVEFEPGEGTVRMRHVPAGHRQLRALLDQVLPREAAMKYLYGRLQGKKRCTEDGCVMP